MSPAPSYIPIRLALLIFCCICAGLSFGSDIGVGHWRHHLPGHRIIALAETPEEVFGATPYGLIVFNKTEQSIRPFNKVHGLSDFGISALAYSTDKERLVVGYENGNIDVIAQDQVWNVVDIVQSNIPGSKRINRIAIAGNRALLACAFGIVELDLTQLLIMDTWFIGPFGSMVNVNDVLIANDNIYAATGAGLLRASKDAPNLADFNNWIREEVSEHSQESFNFLTLHDGEVLANLHSEAGDRLYRKNGQHWNWFRPGGADYNQTKTLVVSNGSRLLVGSAGWLDVFGPQMQFLERIDNYHPGTPSPMDAWVGQSDQLWIGDRQHGLVRRKGIQSFERISLPGPPHNTSFGLASGGGRIWVAPGGISYGGDNQWNQNGYYLFEKGRWRAFDRFGFPILEPVADLISISIDPGNPNRAYAASWLAGMVELSPEGPQMLYDESNSPLRRRAGIGDRLRIGGTAVDRQGNVWVTNSEVEKPLAVKKPNGDWLAYSGGSLIGPQTVVGDLIIDQSGQKWVILPRNGIYLFKEDNLENPGAFNARRLTTQSGQGNLPNINVHSLAADHNGYVWVGTEAGVAVFYTPQRAFSGEAFEAQRIVVEQEDGFAGYLLETQTVSSIAIDGSNKKWFGTSRSGAFLISPDGRETLLHFNQNNSPLPSNNILDITINGQNGEVFFATDKGLVSFRGFATEAPVVHSDVYAFPNPVRPGYAGYISIRGLVRNAHVKITDIAGHLVYETRAEGGQAVWNGQDLRGNRPSSGVYLVFSTNDNGEETMVTKILFMN